MCSEPLTQFPSAITNTNKNQNTMLQGCEVFRTEAFPIPSLLPQIQTGIHNLSQSTVLSNVLG